MALGATPLAVQWLVLRRALLLLLFVATSAAFLPARRASRLSPIIAIRCD